VVTVSDSVFNSTFRKGEVIFSTGDVANKLYIICSGKTKVCKFSPDGKEQIIYILAAGDFIGAFNLLKKDKFEFDMIALEETSISTLDKDAFDSLILSNPSITLKVLEKAYERITKAEQLVERLSLVSLDSRVAGLLLGLEKDFGTSTGEGLLLNLTMNREEMGAYSGITRETMSRKLNLFQENGWLKLIGSKQILIVDDTALRELIT
jgi:CRP-like cAMP-binding protein